jgi:hypothetical protein
MLFRAAAGAYPKERQEGHTRPRHFHWRMIVSAGKFHPERRGRDLIQSLPQVRQSSVAQLRGFPSRDSNVRSSAEIDWPQPLFEFPSDDIAPDLMQFSPGRKVIRPRRLLSLFLRHKKIFHVGPGAA